MPSRARRGLPPPVWSRLRFRGGPLAFAAFAAMVLLYPISLQQAQWIGTTGQLAVLGILGLVFGTLVGNGVMSRRGATYFGAAAGAVAVTIATIAATAPVEAPLRDRAVRLAVQVNGWMTQVAAGEAANDPTVFVLFLGATVWGVAYLSAFLLAREKRPHEAIVFTGTCLVANVSLALTPLTGDLVAFTLCTLVLLVRLHTVTLEERWRVDNLVGAHMSRRVLGGGVAWTVVFILAAFFAPRVGAADALASAFNTFEGPYHRVEAEWQRYFAGVTGPSRLRGISFTESLRLGQAPNLTDELVFTVQSEGSHYWRALTYDFYTGAGWRVSEQERVDKVIPPTGGRVRLDATFDVHTASGSLLFGANEPVKVDVPYQFQGGLDRSYSTALRAVNRFQATGAYTVSSLVSNATKAMLRRASTAYPEEIRTKYLQLPSSLPKRVRDLAQRVAGAQTNAYDKAEVIENYLRERYRYSTNVRAAPSGRDPVDFFLFDVKEDFCEYFASSMVVMLREVGVPARFVEGFSAGTLDAATGRYAVRAFNSHAWVEVYFPQYGWIEFEPTPSEQPVARLDDLPVAAGTDTAGDTAGDTTALDAEAAAEVDELMAGLDDGSASGDFAVSEGVDARPALLALLAPLLAALVAFARFQLRFRGVGPVDAAWGKTRLLCEYAGVAADPALTEYEYAAAIGRALPGSADSARRIAHARVLDSYARGGAPSEARAQAAAAWRELRGTLARRVPARALGALLRLLPAGAASRARRA